MHSRPWQQRLLVVTSVIVLLSVSAGLSSGAQEHSPLVTPLPWSTDQATAPRTPYAQEKIQEALDSGVIDYPTSLLYRAYALFGDPRLPAEFEGAGSFGEDMGLAFEVEAVGTELPAAIREALTPFLVRPTDPRSYFNQPDVNAKRVPVSQRPAAQTKNPDCNNGWLGRRSSKSGVNVKVWARCDGNEEIDVAAVLAIIDPVWQPMTELMGPPILDLGYPYSGGDTAIDFYLVKSGQEIRGATLNEAAMFALTSPAFPFVGKKSSGMILLPRAHIGTTHFTRAVVHEFFHVLQMAHNRSFMFKTRGLLDYIANNQSDEFWFVEASATWAETYFLRSEPIDTHSVRFPPFQFDYPGVSLHASQPSSHPYSAYIWPFFMEQETKSPRVIGEVWKALEAVADDDFDAANRVIDGKFRFSTHFRDFAVRNVNTEFKGDPIKPRYQELDRAVPDDPPRLEILSYDALWYGQPPFRHPRTIPSLTATYDAYRPSPDTRQVTFRFDDLQPNSALDVDVIYKIKGERDWVRRKLSPGEKLRFCFNKPKEKLEDLLLILSNHSMEIDTTITGTYSVLPLDVPCGEYRIEGRYEVYWGGNGGVGPLIDSWSFEGEFSLSKDIPPGQPPDPNKPSGHGTFRGQQGRFKPGQKGCNPASSRSWSGQLTISAVVDGEKLKLIIMPVVPVGTDSVPDVFSTRLDSDQYGGKKVTVPLEGGTYTWGGGVWGIEVDCGGLKPASGGSFTVVKIRDDADSGT